MRAANILFLALSVAMAAHAQETPEVKRVASTPQAVGVRNSLRTIPEACARIEGQFTGDAAKPYLFEVVNTTPACHPRARLRDAAEAKPAQANGWILNDVIRVPSAACPTQSAVVTVWRKPSTKAAPPKPDSLGRTRVYMGGKEDTLKAQGGIDALPQYAIATAVEGKGCK